VTTALRLENACKHYQMGQTTIAALDGIDLVLDVGDYLAVMGPSGSGKSTLLNVLGCLDRINSGRYILADRDVSAFDDDQLSAVRRQYLGFIFQSYNLIPQLTVLENIEVPLYYQGWDAARSHARSLELAELVGLAQRADHRPTELSGGQQQRVAIARSLANDPQLILADEPTGNLDTATGLEILLLMDDLNRAGKTLVMVTHEREVANRAGRTIHLRDGRIESEKRR
jgi:putative ABC transport system ATP-binding protein